MKLHIWKQTLFIFLLICVVSTHIFGQNGELIKFEIDENSSEEFAQIAERFYILHKNTLDGVKYGIIDIENNDTIIMPKYDDLGYIGQGAFFVKNNEKCGAIDTAKKVILKMNYLSIGDISENRFFAIDVNGLIQLFDGKGKLIASLPNYDLVNIFSGGVASVTKNGKLGFIDKSGKLIVPLIYAENSTDKFAIRGVIIGMLSSDTTIRDAQLGGLVFKFRYTTTVLHDTKGKMIYKQKPECTPWARSCYVETVNGIYDSCIVICKRSRDGMGEIDHSYCSAAKIINRQGKEIVPYDTYEEISPGTSAMTIRKNGNVGLLDVNGKVIYRPIFKKLTKLEYADNTLARMYFHDDSFFYIDKTGKCVEYDEVTCPE
jgi:hypothetical protein